MRFLHTSDWHVGKTLRGESRLDEHRAVLAEIAGLAAEHSVDAVLVTGDLFESAAPTPDAQRVVWDALLSLRATGATVLAIAGNHDNAASFDAFRPLAAAAGITLLGYPTRAQAGGVVEVRARGGEVAQVALLPFLSQRYAVKAEQVMGLDAAQMTGVYADRFARIVAALCEAMRDDAVRVLCTHATLRGGRRGGGERDAQTILEYEVDPSVFPAALHYVAAGHLHRTQSIDAPAPCWYPGSPVQVDFGEEGHDSAVLLVESRLGVRTTVRALPLSSPARLQTLRGSMAQLEALAGTTGDTWLRIVVEELGRPGISDEVRALFPRAVDVRVQSAPVSDSRERRERADQSPRELFTQFLDETGHARDQRLLELFDELVDEVVAEEAWR